MNGNGVEITDEYILIGIESIIKFINRVYAPTFLNDCCDRRFHASLLTASQKYVIIK